MHMYAYLCMFVIIITGTLQIWQMLFKDVANTKTAQFVHFIRWVWLGIHMWYSSIQVSVQSLTE